MVVGSPPDVSFDFGKNDTLAGSRTPEDIETLGENKVGVVHNVESNLKLGTGICPVPELRSAGALVALGTDGVASNNNLDLFQEADHCAKLQCYRAGIGKLPATEVVRLLTEEGARALGLGNVIGTLEVGKAADVIAVDLNQPHLTPMYHPQSHLVYSASASDVRHSVINGRVVMEDRKLLTLDLDRILAKAREWGARIRG